MRSLLRVVALLAYLLPIAQAAQRNITVDDTASRISYTGSGWFAFDDAGWSNGTGHTTCGNLTKDARATFNFTGVAIYYLFPSPSICNNLTINGAATNLSSTTLILDGTAIAVQFDALPKNPAGSGIWGRTGLSNGNHTIVNAATSTADIARVDAFIYTAEEPDTIPSAPAGMQNIFLGADNFTLSEGWSNSTDPVPDCVQNKHVLRASMPNSNFSFNFTGDVLFLNTLASPDGGGLAISINGDDPEVFNTTGADTQSCAVFSLNVTSLVRRSLLRRAGGGSSSAMVQNHCSGKSVDGSPAIDGATYQRAASGVRRGSVNLVVLLGAFLLFLLLGDYPRIEIRNPFTLKISIN
ncbi:hypothetical protein R3P38DRAFT_3469044 [Favolaschia claudopus]|uniref:Uncharacterized protein n=1 Tax=Favolaschia claudopus TaxID=2862362 RepID=A0AAW0CM39_9AGAR